MKVKHLKRISDSCGPFSPRIEQLLLNLCIFHGKSFCGNYFIKETVFLLIKL